MKKYTMICGLALFIILGTCIAFAENNKSEFTEYTSPRKFEILIPQMLIDNAQKDTETIDVISVTGGKVFFSQTQNSANRATTSTAYYLQDLATGSTILIENVQNQIFGVNTPAIIGDRYIYFTVGINTKISSINSSIEKWDVELKLMCADVYTGTMKEVNKVESKQPYLQLNTVDQKNIILFDTGYSKDGVYYSKLDKLNVSNSSIENITICKIDEKNGEGEYICSVNSSNEKIYTLIQKTYKSSSDIKNKDINGNISEFRIDCMNANGKLLYSIDLSEIQDFFIDPYTKGYYNMIFDFRVEENTILLSDNLLNTIVIKFNEKKELDILYKGERLFSSEFINGVYLIDRVGGEQYLLSKKGLSKSKCWGMSDIGEVWDDEKGNTVLLQNVNDPLVGYIQNYYITSIKAKK